MMTIQVRDRRTRAQLAELHAAILASVENDEDWPATVRGVFYRVMSTGAVPKSEKGYAVVQREVLKMRRSGDLPYHKIIDGTRWRMQPDAWDDLDHMLAESRSFYRRRLWNDQPTYVEIWSEKDAITGIVRKVTYEYDVPLMVARGFPGETFLWGAGQEINEIGKPTVIYQLDDHDPSGVAAWEHTQRALRKFCPDADLTFERLAVTPEQIDTFNLQTRPTKQSDSRARTFDGESVEVDAIPTRILRQIVRDAIESRIDAKALMLTRIAEDSEQDILGDIAGRERRRRP